MALRVRTGRPDEWQEILDVSHAAFGRDKTFFPHNWPHTYPDKTAAEWFVVCEDAGKIVGTINQTPVTVDVCGVRLKAVGIGGVGVLESARLRVADAKDILKLYRKAPMFISRDESWQALLLRRRSYVACGNKSGPLRAYLVTPKGMPGSVCELIGDARLLPGLLKSWMKRHKLGQVGITFIPGYAPHAALARDAAWLQDSPAEQVGIYDFGRFLTQLANPLGERFRQFAIIGVVRVAHTGEKTAFDLKLKRSGTLSVTPATGNRKPALSLDAAGWVRTFFPPPGGQTPKSQPDARLAAAFALPMNFSGWDSV